MKPHIDQTQFGSITIEGTVFDHDVFIGQDGHVKKRKKKLSKAIYGTSHILSEDEARYVYEEGTKKLIIGSGQYNNVRLSREAAEYLQSQKCEVDLLPTPEAIQVWNEMAGPAISLFHVTC